MDLDILDFLEDATREADAFEHHPARELSLEERLLYLNGLALVMNADGHVDDEEKEYLRILIKSFEMDEATLDSFVEFAQSPDKDTVQAFFRTFRRKPIAQLFLFDALMMTRRDGKVAEKEIAVVNKIAEQLEILKGTQNDIFDLFCHIKNRNWQESALYFDSCLLNPEHFKHLLDYNEISFDDLLEEYKDIRKTRLIEIIKPKLLTNIEWGVFSCSGSLQEERQITKSPITISSAISNELILPWLQSMLDKGAIRVTAESAYLVGTHNEKLLFSFESVAYRYDKEAASFYLENEHLDSVGSGPLLDSFIELNELNELNYFLNLVGATEVAIANSNHLPTCDGKQVSAVTVGHDFAILGHLNAISKINDTEVEIRYCNHCNEGHGSKSTICDDGDKRFVYIPMNEMLTTHGFYLVK